jgi:hypothetical protein
MDVHLTRAEPGSGSVEDYTRCPEYAKSTETQLEQDVFRRFDCVKLRYQAKPFLGVGQYGLPILSTLKSLLNFGPATNVRDSIMRDSEDRVEGLHHVFFVRHIPICWQRHRLCVFPGESRRESPL